MNKLYLTLFLLLQSNLVFAAVKDGRWHASIGDPTIFGWITVVAYLLAVICSLRQARIVKAQGGTARFWLVMAAVLFVFGGWSMVLWGVFLRTVWGWHCTWLVNSATHLWGSRRFETRDDSRNNFLVAILTWGEGWHNNHHAYPRSARHGLNWKELDINWIELRVLEKLGLIKDVYAIDLNHQDEKEQLAKAA